MATQTQIDMKKIRVYKTFINQAINELNSDRKTNEVITSFELDFYLKVLNEKEYEELTKNFEYLQSENIDGIGRVFEDTFRFNNYLIKFVYLLDDTKKELLLFNFRVLPQSS